MICMILFWVVLLSEACLTEGFYLSPCLYENTGLFMQKREGWNEGMQCKHLVPHDHRLVMWLAATQLRFPEALYPAHLWSILSACVITTFGAEWWCWHLLRREGPHLEPLFRLRHDHAPIIPRHFSYEHHWPDPECLLPSGPCARHAGWALCSRPDGLLTFNAWMFACSGSSPVPLTAGGKRTPSSSTPGTSSSTPTLSDEFIHISLAPSVAVPSNKVQCRFTLHGNRWGGVKGLAE